VSDVTGDVRAAIRDYIAGFLLDEGTEFDVAFDTPLLSSGLLDSVAVEELLRFLEEDFGIEFEDEELNAEAFETIDVIAVLVEAKRGAAA
jgi:acyl carrier protein